MARIIDAGRLQPNISWQRREAGEMARTGSQRMCCTWKRADGAWRQTHIDASRLLLSRLADSDDALIAEHARWALAQLALQGPLVGFSG